METPTITGSAYTSTTIDTTNYLAALAASNTGSMGDTTRRHMLAGNAQSIPAPVFQHASQSQEEPPVADATRFVQVFIADPNENIPLDKRLLYTGPQKLTDLTDQELFFEIDMKALLDKHNDMRAKTVIKAVKERTEYLEPARIRDLKMTVVTIAKF